MYIIRFIYYEGILIFENVLYCFCKINYVYCSSYGIGNWEDDIYGVFKFGFKIAGYEKISFI